MTLWSEAKAPKNFFIKIKPDSGFLPLLTTASFSKNRSYFVNVTAFSVFRFEVVFSIIKNVFPGLIKLIL